MIELPDLEDIIDTASRRWEASDKYDDLDCRCPECGARYAGSDRSGGHCRGGAYGGCCQSFRSQYAADKHRVGPHGGGRRCLSEIELRGKGWTKDEQGAWRTPPPERPIWKKSGS